jgi:hypothetical protein
MRKTFAGLGAVLVMLGFPVAARAHNAGHIILPDGTCLEIGSFRDAPIVGKDRTQLDLIPQTPNPPFDEIGASFAAFQGLTPILPGPCGVPPTSSAASQTAVKQATAPKAPSDVELRGAFHSSSKAMRGPRGSARY